MQSARAFNINAANRHQSGMKYFKYYYQSIIKGYLKSYFPNSYTYENFVAKMQCIAAYLWLFLQGMRLSLPTEANFIDATKLVVCHIEVANVHKNFQSTNFFCLHYNLTLNAGT